MDKPICLLRRAGRTALGLLIFSLGVHWTGLVPELESLPAGVALMAAGLLILALGQYFYMSAGLGCGPRDALLVGLGKRLARLPIGVVTSLLLGAVLLAGWALGAPIGVGTVLAVFGEGAALQLVCRLMHFEPRSVTHLGLAETAGAMPRQ